MTKNRARSSFARLSLGLTIATGIVVSLTAASCVPPGGSACNTDADCDDGIFCNGIESCDTTTNSCVAISSCPPSIPPTVCNEDTDSCDPVECLSDADCDDGLFCTGIESCDTTTHSCVAISACPPSIPPTVCNEDTDSCDPS